MTTATKIPTLTVDQATAIINEAKAHGAFKSEMPEDESERMRAARHTIEQAVDAWHRGVRNPGLTAVVSLARIGNEDIMPSLDDGQKQPPEPDQPEPGKDIPDAPLSPEAPPSTPDPGTEENPQQLVDSKAGDLPTGPGELPPLPGGRNRVINRAKTLGLPIPQPVKEDEVDPMPRDLTTLDDLQLRRVHGEWHGVYAWAQWNTSLEEADAAASEHMLDYARGHALRGLPKIDPDSGKAKLADVIKAEVEADETVKAMADRHSEHAIAAKTMKGLTAIYQGNVDRVSREITARRDTWERAHQR